MQWRAEDRIRKDGQLVETHAGQRGSKRLATHRSHSRSAVLQLGRLRFRQGGGRDMKQLGGKYVQVAAFTKHAGDPAQVVQDRKSTFVGSSTIDIHQHAVQATQAAQAHPQLVYVLGRVAGQGATGVDLQLREPFPTKGGEAGPRSQVSAQRSTTCAGRRASGFRANSRLG